MKRHDVPNNVELDAFILDGHAPCVSTKKVVKLVVLTCIKTDRQYSTAMGDAYCVDFYFIAMACRIELRVNVQLVGLQFLSVTGPL